MKKRLANLLVALVTMVTGMFVPATAFADPDQTPGANAEEWTEVSTWADLAAALRAGGTVLLTQDVTAGEDDSVLTVPSGVTVTLDLNGHTIDRAAASVTIDGILRATGTDGDVIRLNGGTLTVMDGSAEGTGAITGGCHNYGGGVYVLNGGAFTLAGGSIRGNTATQRTNSVSSNVGGGGVMVIGSGSSFTMTGGKIAENVSTTTFGGAVYLESHASFTMTGGEIIGNTAKLSGAVYMVGGSTFTMTGGTITGNAATDSGKTFGGGGVSVKDGSTFTMSGGTISNNTTYGGRGPGVYVQNGVFTMEDGEISGNRATASAVYGGGVAVYPNTDGESASFTMNGGTISGNGSGYGAGVAVYGSNASFAMNGGTITGNDAGISTYGSGVYVASGAGFSVSGLVNIRGNTQGEAERNVILLGAIGSAPLITIAGPVDPNSSIGVYNYFTSSSAIQITNGLNGEDFGFLYADNGSYMFDRHTDGLEAALYKVEMYSVSVKTPVNGTLAADKTQAKAGTRICLTLTPEPTYRVDHVYYKPENQNEREINPVNGVYSFSMPDKDVIVRAVFSVIKLNVGLNPGEGGGVASSTQIQPANGIYTYTLPACPFTAPENKFFDGWGLDGSSYQPGDTVTLTEDCVFTAQWRSAVVHFDANGGTGVMADALCGTSYTLPDCAFTAPKGKLFTGWLVDGTVEQPGTVISVDSSITVTAQWTTAYTISRVSNGFKITRAITGSAETVAYRTVSQSAIAGVHFNATSGTASFNAEDDATIVTVAELAAGDNINFYYLNGSAKRSYRFEVLSTGNKEVLASYNREIDFNTSYKVPSSGAYDVKTVTVKSGETTITDDGYDNNSPISYALSGYYALVAPQNYYRLTGAELHMTLSFSAKEVDDGYQYLSVLTSATAYDNRSGCSNGDPGNIGNSRYMLGFEHSKGGKNTSYASYTMPLTGYGSNCGAAADPWENGVGYLSTQKFNTGCRASDGRLVFPASASTLVLRGNASGDSDDDWVIKNIQANIQAVDTTAPVVNDVVVTQGTYGLGDTVTVALRFSEIVKVGSSSSVYLTTSFGKMEYKGGSGLNTLYFSRTLDTSSLAGALQISSVKLSGCADLAGKACTQTSLGTSSFANVVYEGYNTITVNHNNEATGPDTVYYRKHTPYVLEEPACEAPVGKEFDCYQVGSVQYQPGESFTPEAAATAVDIVWKWQTLPVTFYDEDGETVLYTGSFQYGLSPEYPVDENVAPALEKACDAGYHYSFAGWTDGEQTYADELPAVTEPAVYAVVYASEAHDWGAPSYSWSRNGGSWSVTASRVCMVCGRTETEDGAVTSEITRAATCLELGETTYTGTFASESFATQVKAETDLPALGHDYVAVVTAPTCTERGYTTHTCSRCQDSYVDTHTDALGHDFGEWTLTAAPTCTEAGEETRHCSRCDATETRPVNALGHDYVAVVTAPTCTERGYTTHTCSRCQDRYVDTYIDALGHGYVAVVTAPTCTERGYTTHTCSRCQDRYVDTYIDALGHDFGEWILTLAPTCTDAGVETRTCSRCDATETRPVNARGHDYVAVVTAPTCTERGYTTHTCSRCQDSYVDTYTDALGHDFGEWILTLAPTCTDAGVETRTCSRCDATETRPVDALGHDYVAAVTAPTCTERGYTTHTCSRCQDRYVDTYIDALGHDFGEWTLTTAPTCTEAGEETRHCSRCGNEQVRAVDALGHDWGAWTETTAPTCTNEGVKTHTCSRCQQAETEAIAALGHRYVTTATPGDYPQKTQTTYTCSHCGNAVTSQTLKFDLVNGTRFEAELIEAVRRILAYEGGERFTDADGTPGYCSNGAKVSITSESSVTVDFYADDNYEKMLCSVCLSIETDAETGRPVWAHSWEADDSWTSPYAVLHLPGEADSPIVFVLCPVPHSITVQNTDTAHGTIYTEDGYSNAKDEASVNDRVYLAYRSNGTWGIRDWTVTNSDTGETVTLDIDPNIGYYFFVMPDAPVTVSGTFEPMYRLSWTDTAEAKFYTLEVNGRVIDLSGQCFYLFSDDEVEVRYLITDPRLDLTSMTAARAGGGIVEDTALVFNGYIWIFTFTMPADGVTLTPATGRADYPSLQTGDNPLDQMENAGYFWYTPEEDGLYSFACSDGYYEVSIIGQPDGPSSFALVGGTEYLVRYYCEEDSVLTIANTGPITKYNVNISQAAGGTVAADFTSAPAGQTVTLTATPEEGNRSTYLTVKCGSEYLDVTDFTKGRLFGGEAVYEFEMPAGDVTVEAGFAPRKCKISFLYQMPDGEQYNLYDSVENLYCDPGETPDLSLVEAYILDYLRGSDYLFAGWAEEPGPAWDDTTYIALFVEAGDWYRITVADDRIYAQYNIAGPFGYEACGEAPAGSKIVLSAGGDFLTGIAGWTVTDAQGNAVPLDIDEYGFPCFVMPENDITVAAEYTDVVNTILIDDDTDDYIGSGINGALAMGGSFAFAAPGETVNMLFFDEPAKELAVTVKPANGVAFTVGSEPRSYYGCTFRFVSFTMPESDVTVSSKWTKSGELPALALGINEIDMSKVYGFDTVAYTLTPQETGIYRFTGIGRDYWNADILDAFGCNIGRISSHSPSVCLIGGSTYELRFDFGGGESYLWYLMIEKTSEAVTVYPITVEEVEHGSIVASVSEAPEGYRVTLCAIPDTGYCMPSYPCVTGPDGSVIVSNDGNDTYEFTMPAGPVTVTAAFTLACPMYIYGTDEYMKAKYFAWAAQYGADVNSEHEAAFLMNVSPSAAPIELRIVDIKVGEDGARVRVACRAGASAEAGGVPVDLSKSNGAISVVAGDAPDALTPNDVAAESIVYEDGVAVICVPPSYGRFIKAVIGLPIIIK